MGGRASVLPQQGKFWGDAGSGADHRATVGAGSPWGVRCDQIRDVVLLVGSVPKPR